MAIYDTFYENQDLIDEKGQFESGKIDCAVFTSASTVKGFVAATEGLDYTKVLAACIGKQTQEEALRYGMKTAVAKEASIDSLVELVIKLKGQREKNKIRQKVTEEKRKNSHGYDKETEKTPRRETIRKMVRETRMDKSSLIYPMFVREGSGNKRRNSGNGRTVPLHHRHHVLCVRGFGKSGCQKCYVFWDSRCKR